MAQLRCGPLEDQVPVVEDVGAVGDAQRHVDVLLDEEDPCAGLGDDAAQDGHQPLDDDGLERFSLAFGPFGEDPFIAPIPGREHVLEVRREADETAPIFAETWHSDWSFLARPPSASILHGRVIPPVGGDTLFADQYAAYEALADDLKAAIEGRNAVHSAGRAYGPDGVYGARGVGRSMDIRPSEAALASRTHPMVRTHPETGRKALFVNPGYTIAIEGMDEDEGWALLLKLFKIFL